MIDWETRLACASESDESLEEMSKSVTSSIEFEQTHYLKVRKFFEQKVQQAKEESWNANCTRELNILAKSPVHDENFESNNDKQFNFGNDNEFDLSSILDCYSEKSVNSLEKVARQGSRVFEYQKANYVVLPGSGNDKSKEELSCLTNKNDNQSTTIAQLALQTPGLGVQSNISRQEKFGRSEGGEIIDLGRLVFHQECPHISHKSSSSEIVKQKLNSNFPVTKCLVRPNKRTNLDQNEHQKCVFRVFSDKRKPRIVSIMEKTDSSQDDTDDSDIVSVSQQTFFHQNQCINQTKPINQSEYVQYRFNTGNGRLYSGYYDNASLSNCDYHTDQYAKMVPLAKLPSPMSFEKSFDDFESNIFDRENHNMSNNTTNTMTTTVVDDKQFSSTSDKFMSNGNLLRTGQTNFISLNDTPDYLDQSKYQHSMSNKNVQNSNMKQNKSKRLAHKLKQAFSRTSAARI
ncbi:hypothetical protein AWRI3579_g1870 [Hanseniaspora osmophila]|uniref:Uncharacterized protein n=1 Tax=Hanseniaspora osmophila TaxID=56408 RepID=A0A1E5RER0_9ASCO|nr:hypothetical protein AWRI3579_g1870 [Hanseniaspora osmophila]